MGLEVLSEATPLLDMQKQTKAINKEEDVLNLFCMLWPKEFFDPKNNVTHVVKIKARVDTVIQIKQNAKFYQRFFLI